MFREIGGLRRAIFALAFATFYGRTEPELLAWLRRILLNHLANVVRRFHDTDKREVSREVPLGDVVNTSGEPAGNPAGTPSSRALAREAAGALQAALAELPEPHREVVYLRNWDRLSFEQIAHRVGRSPEACRKLWARAIEQLGQRLESRREP